MKRPWKALNFLTSDGGTLHVVMLFPGLVLVVCDLSVGFPYAVIQQNSCLPHAGSGLDRIDPLHFLAGCHKSQRNQALFFLLA